MKAEEKQAMIKHIHGYQQLRTHSNVVIGDDIKDRIYQVALAALTAPPVPVMQPVKQPGTECIGWVKEAIWEHDAKWRDTIRAAGYEVQE